MTEITGGSPYGSSTLAGADGKRMEGRVIGAKGTTGSSSRRALRSTHHPVGGRRDPLLRGHEWGDLVPGPRQAAARSGGGGGDRRRHRKGGPKPMSDGHPPTPRAITTSPTWQTTPSRSSTGRPAGDPGPGRAAQLAGRPELWRAWLALYRRESAPPRPDAERRGRGRQAPFRIMRVYTGTEGIAGVDVRADLASWSVERFQSLGIREPLR